jgi:hypothetical protein
MSCGEGVAVLVSGDVAVGHTEFVSVVQDVGAWQERDDGLHESCSARITVGPSRCRARYVVVGARPHHYGALWERGHRVGDDPGQCGRFEWCEQEREVQRQLQLVFLAVIRCELVDAGHPRLTYQ